MKHLWRRARALLALALTLLALTGCTPILAIDQRALALAVGFDRDPCGVRVTAQWYASVPSLFVNGMVRPQTESACGPTAGDAVSALRRETNRYVDFAVTNLVLVGRALAEAGTANALDLVWREGDLPESAQVAVADGRAQSLLSPATDEEGFLLYTRLADSGLNNTEVTPIPLWRFVSRRFGLPGDAWAPIVEQTGTGARSAGVAVFSAGRMVAAMGGRQATAFGWLTKIGGYGELNIPAHVPVSLRVVRSRLQRSCAGAGPALVLTLYTRLRQGERVRLRGRDASDLSDLAARAAWRDASGALQTLIRSGADPLGLRTTGCPGTSLERPVRTVRLTVEVRVRPDEREA